MSIDRATIAHTVAILSSIDGVRIRPGDLVEDTSYLALSFPQRLAYETAVVNTAKALKDIARNRVSCDELSGAYQGWESYHYQPKVGQGIAADMRVVFKREPEAIRILGFGHRYIPDDLYKRLNALQRNKE